MASEFDDRGTGFLEDDATFEHPRLAGQEDALFGDGDGQGRDNNDHVPDVLEQGNANSCTAFSLIQCARVLLSLQGVPNPPLLSAQDIYYNSRENKHADTGAAIGAMMLAVLSNGYCLDVDCPYDPKKVLVAPPPSVRSKTYDQVGKILYYRTEDWGTGKRETQIRRAFDAGYLVIGGFPIDRTFREYTGGIWDYPGKEDASDAQGWHAALGTGYSEYGMEIVNSWGPRWGKQDRRGRYGFGTIGWTTIRNAYLYRQGYVVMLAPKPTGV